MRMVFLDQGSEAWLKWREEGLTATESAVVLGLSPYKTPWRLWAEKTHCLKPQDLSNNPLVRYGREHESIARRAYESKTQDELMVLCGEYDEDSRFRASFDGIDKDGAPVEFKCPSQSTFSDVKSQKTESEAFRLYNIQVQHQMLVAGADHGHLVFFNGESAEMIVFHIERDKRMIRRILREGDLFCEKVRKRNPPEKDPQRDFFVPEGDASVQWKTSALDIIGAIQRIKDCESRIEELRSKMQPARDVINQLMGENVCANYGGLIVSRVSSAGRVDYVKMVRDLLGREPTEAELDQYRTEQTDRLKIRLAKDGESFVSDDDQTVTSSAVNPQTFWL